MAAITIPSKRLNEKQKEVLINYITEHPKLCTGLLTGSFTASEKCRMWNELARMLNACPKGARRSAESWKGCWQDLKSLVKKKLSKIKEAEETGAGLTRTIHLSIFEQKVAKLVEDTSVEPAGVATGTPTTDSTIGFTTTPTVELATAPTEVSLEPDKQTHPVAVGETCVLFVKCQDNIQQNSVFVPLTMPPPTQIVRAPLLVDSQSQTSEDINLKSQNGILKRKRSELEKTSEKGIMSSYQINKLALHQRRADTMERLASAEERKAAAEEKKAEAEDRKAQAEERKAKALEQISSLLVLFIKKEEYII